MKTVINVKVANLKMHKSYASIYATKNKQLELLIDSIRQTKGILTPIVINKKNEIINGVQRWLAYKHLDKKVIPATVLEDVNPDDEVLYIISYNRHKDKTMHERWQEIKAMKTIWGKRQGERSDLMEGSDKISTRKKIALHMNISEGNVYKIEKVAESNIGLLGLVDTKEISLHEAYERAMQKSGVQTKSKVQLSKSTNSEIPEQVEDCTCPNCGHNFINQ
jgi:hypothetical protein